MKVVKRPWGYFRQFVLNEKCTVKILGVKPFGELSLQKHNRRREIWYFLTDGWVQIGMRKRKVKKGENIIVRKGVAHRIFSKGFKVEVLEICFGSFDEKDEIRLEDKYERI